MSDLFLAWFMLIEANEAEGKTMAKETKSAEELAAMIIEGLRAEGVPAVSLEVYGIDEPSLEMNWTIRKLRLEASAAVKVEAAVKRVLFPIVNQYDLAI